MVATVVDEKVEDWAAEEAAHCSSLYSRSLEPSSAHTRSEQL